MSTIEKKIESVQEYNLIKLLKANTNPSRLDMKYLRLNHELCRAFATNGYVIIIADLEPNEWNEIFGSLPELVFINKLNRNEIWYFKPKAESIISYIPIFEAVGKEPEYQPVTHLNLKLLKNLIDKFDDIYLVKQAGQALFMRLEGDKYPHGKYHGAIMPKTITKEETDKIIEYLASFATDCDNRKQYVMDKKDFYNIDI